MGRGTKVWVVLPVALVVGAVVVVSVNRATGADLPAVTDRTERGEDGPATSEPQRSPELLPGQSGERGERSLPAHEVNEETTGPTAYFDEELGRFLEYDDLAPSGPVVTSRDGEVIERLDIEGDIRIAHDDVVIRAVRIRNQGSLYSISYASEVDVGGVEISYVEVDGGGDPDNIGIHLWDFELRSSHVYEQSTGVNFGSNSTIEYNFVHSQALKPGSHNTAMSMHGGSAAEIRGNNLEGSTSSALSLYPRLAPVVDVLVEGNLFNGGSYCVYAGGGDKEYASESRAVRFIGNAFGRDVHPECGRHGPVANMIDEPASEWRGNAWADTGAPVP